MSTKKGLNIYFTDGKEVFIEFPQQVANSNYVEKRLDEILKHDHLLAEVDGTLMLFPFSNIKYIQVNPAPESLPGYVIKGATFSS
jgi:hypothetical protein